MSRTRKPLALRPDPAAPVRRRRAMAGAGQAHAAADRDSPKPLIDGGGAPYDHVLDRLRAAASPGRWSTSLILTARSKPISNEPQA